MTTRYENVSSSFKILIKIVVPTTCELDYIFGRIRSSTVKKLIEKFESNYWVVDVNIRGGRSGKIAVIREIVESNFTNLDSSSYKKFMIYFLLYSNQKIAFPGSQDAIENFCQHNMQSEKNLLIGSLSNKSWMWTKSSLFL